MPVLPLNSASNDVTPRSALHVMSIGVRVGDNQRVIGYISSIGRTHSRKNTHIKQLEPYPISPSSGFTGQASVNFPNVNVYKDFPLSTYYPGETVEVVPGPLDDETIKVTRYTLFTSTMFEAFMRASFDKAMQATSVEDPTTRLVSLLQQVRPVDLYEIWISPINGNVIYGIIYQDCWFKDLGHTVDIGRDTVQTMDATLDVTRTRPYIVS